MLKGVTLCILILLSPLKLAAAQKAYARDSGTVVFDHPESKRDIAHLRFNQKVDVVEVGNNGWTKIKLKRGFGYVPTAELSTKKTRVDKADSPQGSWPDVFIEALTAFLQGLASPGTSTYAKVMIFGGPGHATYLGCLNCSQYATDSVLNRYGSYGSPYSADSIWNRYGEYGSRYSQYSPCNPYAIEPPVIVDEYGNAYGRLTLNRYHPYIGAGARLLGWLAAVCQ